jgi:hypothetical protein
MMGWLDSQLCCSCSSYLALDSLAVKQHRLIAKTPAAGWNGVLKGASDWHTDCLVRTIVMKHGGIGTGKGVFAVDCAQKLVTVAKLWGCLYRQPQ